MAKKLKFPKTKRETLARTSACWWQPWNQPVAWATFEALLAARTAGSHHVFYLLCTLVIGLPVLLAELSIGREGRGDAVRSLQRVAPGTFWWIIGASGVLAAFLIMSFYAEVSGWVLAYIVKAIGGTALSTDSAVTSEAFTSLVTNPGSRFGPVGGAGSYRRHHHAGRQQGIKPPPSA